MQITEKLKFEYKTKYIETLYKTLHFRQGDALLHFYSI